MKLTQPDMEAEIPPELMEPEFKILNLTEIPALPPAGADSGEDAGERPRREVPREASGKAPTPEEWQEFLGCTVLRLATEGYLQLVLWRVVDESDLSPRERELIRLDRDDLRDMAAPMASVAAKGKVGKKHGRTIISAAESYEALIDLFFWIKRVHKIARVHRRNATVTRTEDESGVFTEGIIVDGPLPNTNPEPGNGTIGGIFNRGTG